MATLRSHKPVKGTESSHSLRDRDKDFFVALTFRSAFFKDDHLRPARIITCLMAKIYFAIIATRDPNHALWEYASRRRLSPAAV
jgi:hypothetical protein